MSAFGGKADISGPLLLRCARSRVCRTRSDPDTTVLIPLIAFEPFDRPRRQIIGNHPPAIEPERGMVEAGVSERNRGVTRSARAGWTTQGDCHVYTLSCRR